MAFDLTAADAMLKENYDSGVIMDLVTQRHPLLAAIQKDTEWGGDVKVVPLQYGNPQGVQSGSGNFSTSNISTSTLVKWNVTSTQHYNHFDVSRELIKTSETQKGAFEQGLDLEVRSCLKELGRDLARQLFGTNDNQLAQATAGTATTFTVSTRDAKKFEIGMRLMFDDTSTGASPKTGVGTVSAVNYSTGVITFTGTVDGGTGPAANDYIFREGAISSSTQTGIVGLDQWLGTSTALFGVTRTAHSRLQGQAIDATGLSIEEAFIDAVIKIDEEGGYCDLIVTDHDTYRKLQVSQNSDRRYPAGAGDELARIGFNQIKMVDGAMVVPDRFCPANTAYALSLDSWKLCSRGDLIEFVDEDGHILDRNGSDGFRGYVASYCQLVCDAPIHNAKISNLS